MGCINTGIDISKYILNQIKFIGIISEVMSLVLNRRVFLNKVKILDEVCDLFEQYSGLMTRIHQDTNESYVCWCWVNSRQLAFMAVSF